MLAGQALLDVAAHVGGCRIGHGGSILATRGALACQFEHDASQPGPLVGRALQARPIHQASGSGLYLSPSNTCHFGVRHVTFAT
jgi:hypothetical protein